MPNGSTRYRNIVIFLASLVFYAWLEPVYVVILILQCISSWTFGLYIDKYRGSKISKILMFCSVSVDISVLLVFKYADFFIDNVNFFFNAEIGLLSLLLPVGISFYTFQNLSYTIDLYKGRIEVNRNLIDFSTYVTMFPMLVAGPIVRYATVETLLAKRKHSMEDIAIGSRRFVIGLAKKILIANVMGELAAIYGYSSENSVLFAWMYVLAYALQIYFDFSGYSDMAIGLARIFGFRLLENFNYPYIAKSITDFWRRWHISLSTWFRDYIYFPMGGSRTSSKRHIFNLIFVWFLTGFWHGADWNFIIWGLYFAVVLLLEKYVLHKVLEKAPKFICHGYVMFIVLVSWVFFDAASLSAIGETLSQMFGIGVSGFAGTESLYYLRSYAVPIVIGIIGSTQLPKILAYKLKSKYLVVAEPVAIAALLIVSTAYLVDGSFNPFIYFRF